jgi:hypothetical protein
MFQCLIRRDGNSSATLGPLLGFSALGFNASFGVMGIQARERHER